MTWDESKHPRDPEGSKTGGQWTVAEKAARKGAKLLYDVPGGSVSIVPGRTTMPKYLSEQLGSMYPDGVRVIYNSETGNWHIANNGLEDINHGDFTNQALEGSFPQFTEQIQARGTFNIATGTLTMYDFTPMAAEFGDGPAEEKRVTYQLKRVMASVESGVFHFISPINGRTRKATIDWVSMLEILGG